MPDFESSQYLLFLMHSSSFTYTFFSVIIASDFVGDFKVWLVRRRCDSVSAEQSFVTNNASQQPILRHFDDATLAALVEKCCSYLNLKKHNVLGRELASPFDVWRIVVRVVGSVGC